MKEKIKAMIRERMIGLVKEAYKDNPMKDTPFEGIMIRNTIATANKNYKEGFILQKDKLGLTEKEINEIVDEVTSQILDEIFE
jgi:hypothetical protein